MADRLPKSIDPSDYKAVGDALVNTPMIDLRYLQMYLEETYGVSLKISIPVEEKPKSIAGYAKGE